MCPAFKEYYNGIGTKGEFKKFLNNLEDKYGNNITSITSDFKQEMFREYANAYSVLDDIIA